VKSYAAENATSCSILAHCFVCYLPRSSLAADENLAKMANRGCSVAARAVAMSFLTSWSSTALDSAALTASTTLHCRARTHEWHDAAVPVPRRTLISAKSDTARSVAALFAPPLNSVVIRRRPVRPRGPAPPPSVGPPHRLGSPDCRRPDVPPAGRARARAGGRIVPSRPPES